MPNLLERLTKKTTADRRKLEDEYRRIVQRGDTASQKEIARLTELLPALGLTQADVQEHRRLLESHAALLEQAGTAEVVKKEIAADEKACKTALSDTRQAEKAAEAARHRADALRNGLTRKRLRWASCDEAARQAERIEKSYPLLFGAKR